MLKEDMKSGTRIYRQKNDRMRWKSTQDARLGTPGSHKFKGICFSDSFNNSA